MPPTPAVRTVARVGEFPSCFLYGNAPEHWSLQVGRGDTISGGGHLQMLRCPERHARARRQPSPSPSPSGIPAPGSRRINLARHLHACNPAWETPTRSDAHPEPPPLPSGIQAPSWRRMRLAKLCLTAASPRRRS
eukprot:scaffold20146_cov206-Isochrysis_galbana.AAC.5